MNLNFLSILIYLADILQNFAVLFALAGIGTLIVTTVIIVACFINGNDAVSAYQPSSKEYEKQKALYQRAWKSFWFYLIPATLFIMVSLIPSQQTIYLIAGSELAEAGYKSELGQKLATVVNEKIESYITDLTVDNITDQINPNNLTDAERDALIRRLQQ